MNIDTLIHAPLIVPVEPAGVVLENHSLAINDGRIIDILPGNEARSRYQARHDQSFDDHVLLPGLINTHTHAAMSLMRGLADDLPLMTWLEEHIWPVEKKWISADFVQAGSQLACAEMIRGGVTCFNDMYFFPEETARVVEQCGMRATLGLIVIDFPSAWAETADDYIRRGLEVHDQLRGNPLIQTAFAPHAPYSVSDAPLQQIATLVEELDIPVHIHLHEVADEVSRAERELGLRPLQRLDRLGLLSPRLLAVHMTQVNEDDIRRCRETGVNIVHCPESNLKLASGFAPLQRFVEQDINVALGTDGAASNNDLDLFGEMRSAALLAKAVAGDASAIPAETALRMATLNGARALGIEEQTGSLEVGKSADLIAVDLGRIETQPVYHVHSQLVYATGREHVTDVWVAGQHLLKDRQLTTLDETEILARVRQWQGRIGGGE